MVGRRPPATYVSINLPAYDEIHGDDVVLRGIESVSEEEEDSELEELAPGVAIAV